MRFLLQTIMAKIQLGNLARLALVCAVASIAWGGSDYVEPAASYSSDATYPGEDYNVASFLFCYFRHSLYLNEIT